VAEQGFKTILSGPAHPPYGRFCPAPGHQFGFNDLKTLEAGAFLHEVAGGPKAGPDFGQALEFERVIHAIATSAREQRRVTL
jgi:predicted dehydrogenase